MDHFNFNWRGAAFFFLLAVLLGKAPLYGQNIGVNGTGNNPHNSAMLHVEASDKGMIIPRVALNDTSNANPIAVAPAEGLMIYNETGSEPKGYYYWDAGKGQWIQVGSGATDDDWTRDPADGQMYPTNLGDSIGIGVQEPNAELDIRGRDVDLGNDRAAVKVTDQGDGDTLYMDGDEISGGLGGGSGEEKALYLQLGTSEDLVMADGPAQVGIGTAANYPRSNIKLDVDHDGEDIAVRGEGYYGPSYGYLGVQGASNFDGVSSADWSGNEIGVAGISTGSSGSDNYGVIGHSNHWGGYFEHASSGNYVRLGGDAYAMRVVDGNEADGYVLTSDANGNAVWEDPANISSIDSLRDNDWYYESSDSSFLRNVGDEQDCVLVGVNGSDFNHPPDYNYQFAVHNGDATGTQIGIGSVEYLTDQSNETTINNPFSPASDATHDLGGSGLRWDNFYTMEALASNNVAVGTTAPNDPLDVRGQAYIQGNSDVGYTSSKIDLAVDDDDSGLETPGDGKLFLMTDNDSVIKLNQKVGDDYGFVYNDKGDSLDFRFEGPNETHLLYGDRSAGQIGIRTNNPTHDLHVTAASANNAFKVDVDEGAGEDFVIEDDPGDIILKPTGDGEGYIGDASNSWDVVNATNKNFSIKHPQKKGWELRHSSLEGPEAAVYYRGEARLKDGKAVVELPDYFESLTKEEGRTVQLTPIADKKGPISDLAASKVENGEFVVRGIDDANPDQRFYWKVTAVRADVPPIQVEFKKGNERSDEERERWRENYYSKQRK